MVVSGKKSTCSLKQGAFIEFDMRGGVVEDNTEQCTLQKHGKKHDMMPTNLLLLLLLLLL